MRRWGCAVLLCSTAQTREAGRMSISQREQKPALYWHKGDWRVFPANWNSILISLWIICFALYCKRTGCFSGWGIKECWSIYSTQKIHRNIGNITYILSKSCQKGLWWPHTFKNDLWNNRAVKEYVCDSLHLTALTHFIRHLNIFILFCLISKTQIIACHN